MKTLISKLINIYHIFKNSLRYIYRHNLYLFDPSLLSVLIFADIASIVFIIPSVIININKNTHHKSSNVIYKIAKNIIFNFDFTYVGLSFSLLLIFLVYWSYESHKINKYGQISIDLHEYYVNLMKILLSYLFTIINTSFTVISLLLALDKNFTNNVVFLDITVSALPMISMLKIIQLWYSFSLPENSSEIYEWIEIYYNLHKLTKDKTYRLYDALTGKYTKQIHF